MKKVVRNILFSKPKLIGDLLSVRAVAWYGVRRIYASYLGFCLRVRKTVATVDVFTDIGFDSNGNLDIVALMAFASNADGGNVFVQTTYDLTGNGYHAIQNNVTFQPSIVVGGVLQQINNRSAIRTTVAGQYLLANNPNLPQPNYISAVAHNPSYGGSAEIFIDGNSNTNRNNLYYASATQVAFFGGGTPLIATLSSATIPLIFGGLFSGASSLLRINGALQLTAYVGEASLGRIVLMAEGSIISTSFSMAGFLSEAFVFSQNIPTSNDIALLERNQSIYYRITVN